MRESRGRRIVRKLAATFLAPFIFSMAWCSWEIATADEAVYYQGTEFYAMTLIYFFYIGSFVLVYGNIISFIVESVQQKWFERANWLYVLILGVFGSAIGLIFPFWSFIIAGILVAMLFGVIDKWLLKRWQLDEGNKALFITPFIAFALLWSYYHFASSSLPPHTAEQAVEFATSGSGTPIDRFPEEIGTWKGEIEGYQVERTTAVKQVDKETYMVIFMEEWQKGRVNDSWMMAYEVDRNSSILRDEEGDMPPYDE
ncbi:hypothetical protein [Planomicrobium okeanokoites]|uniref:hypothetical protein n=1 Tax=Planomicrobium okeanokoites TaxID=244 RepID=UPI003563BC60